MIEPKIPRDRIQPIELLKFFSAFGIVLFHLQVPGLLIPYSGLICFLVASFYFLPSTITSPGFLIKRIKTLLFPFIAWTIFYGIINMLLKNPFFGENSVPLLFLFMRGSSLHLWYLPFTILITMVISQLMRIEGELGKLYSNLFFFSTLICILFSILIRSHFQESIPAPFAQWIHALPAVAMGLFYGSQVLSSEWQKLLATFAFSILFVIAILLGDKGFGIPYLIGTILTVSCLHFKNIKIPFSIWLGSLSFGIYLIHFFIFMVLEKIGLSSKVHPWFFGLIAFIISAVITSFLKKIKLPLGAKIV